MAEETDLTFINPETGEYFQVGPRRPLIIAAETLGYIPASDEDWERADKIAHWEGFE
jgi:hypothetical protein